MRTVIAVFLVLHAFVHLLYLGQSTRSFELQPGMTWPDEARIFQKSPGNKPTRVLASLMLLTAALMFAAGGAGLLFKQEWWRSLTVAAGCFSALTYFLFWDARLENLANQGWVGILINLLIASVLWIFQWPNL